MFPSPYLLPTTRNIIYLYRGQSSVSGPPPSSPPKRKGHDSANGIGFGMGCNFKEGGGFVHCKRTARPSNKSVIQLFPNLSQICENESYEPRPI